MYFENFQNLSIKVPAKFEKYRNLWEHNSKMLGYHLYLYERIEEHFDGHLDNN